MVPFDDMLHLHAANAPHPEPPDLPTMNDSYLTGIDDGNTPAFPAVLETTDVSTIDSHWHLRVESGALDSDRDGFSDAVERDFGTNPFDPTLHPVVVRSLHFPAGSANNPSGASDLGA